MGATVYQPGEIGGVGYAQRVWLSGGDHPCHSPREIGPDMESGQVLVEAAGIEPASASTPPSALHAYPRLLI